MMKWRVFFILIEGLSLEEIIKKERWDYDFSEILLFLYGISKNLLHNLTFVTNTKKTK